MNPSPKIRRAILPVATFTGVALLHFAWLYFFPEEDPAQSRWVSAAQESFPLKRYIETQGYLLGYSYALSFGFASIALRSYWERRSCHAGNVAFGSLTFSGILAISGCYLIGCCGSPLLGVYLSLFGARFLPLARPLVAAFTTLSIAASWWWMHRSQRDVLRQVSLRQL